jgi:photosystem II stability/assembly factor-like uncharacterized protein
MRRIASLLLVLMALAAPVRAQATTEIPPNPYPPTPGRERARAFDDRLRLNSTSLVRNVALRNVGPTVMSGRVVDVDVNPSDPTQFYVAYATGGLWRTRNAGISFESVFDTESVLFIGDIAVDWARGERIWLGTGENNSSRSSYAGVGLYVSPDSGNTWRHRGLEDTHHIGRIVLDPHNPDVAYVGALGALYSPGGQRGVFKTTDGGATWRQTLTLGGNVGVVDLAMDPAQPGTLYAAAWERTRRGWDFIESGPGSGMYKSTDGGETWQPIGGAGSGFPTGAGVGRIGLDVARSQPGTLYAILDNQAHRPRTADENVNPNAITRERLRTMTRDEFLRIAPALIDDYLDTNGFPASYTAQTILQQVREGTLTPVQLVEYLEDANANLFDTPVIGAEVYRSDDGGATWRKTHEGYLDNVFYSYGYYFGQIRVSPLDARKLYILGVPILRSDDGGRNWVNINGENVHVDHHALWVSPQRPGLLVNGNDGGINVSHDDGLTWFKANTPPVGQFYAVEVDEAEPYNVYGGLQDNGVWKGPSSYRFTAGWYDTGRYPYQRLGGGDGMQVQVDTRDNATTYYGSQFGFYQRAKPGERSAVVRPQHTLGERPPRFNWQSPILLSRHNQDVLYFGTHRLNRSMDKGATFTPLSGDLTGGPRRGDVPWGTLTTIDESPLRFGLLYTGSDDGRIHVSRDGGYSWQRIDTGLPQNLYVSRVAASRHAEGRVYAALNGYRYDHMDPYVYASDDFGQTWQRIGESLPKEPVNVVLEDDRNPNLIYVGTDGGLYLSVDRGQTFMPLMKDIPPVPVHDLKLQRRERDLVVGTHGRSIFIADVGLIQTLDSTMMARRVYAYPVEAVTHSAGWGRSSAVWSEPSTPAIGIAYWSGVTAAATIRVKDKDGLVLYDTTDAAERGLNFVRYDLRVQRRALTRAQQDRYKTAPNGMAYLPVGTYTVEVAAGGQTSTTTLEVKAPPPRRRRSGSTEAAPEVERE